MPRPLAWALPFLWMAGIWFLSSRSFDPGEPSTLFAVFSNLMHAPLYGVLALLWAGALLRRPDGTWPRLRLGEGCLLVLLPFLYGCIDEWHQGSVPGRDPSGMDILTDGVAALAVVLVISYLGGPSRERGLYARLFGWALACVLVAAAGVFL